MLIYDDAKRKLASTTGMVRRKRDGLVLRTPVYLGKGEKPEDYEQANGKARATEL